MVVDVPTVEIYSGDTVTWPTYTFKTDAGVVRDLVAEGWDDWHAQWRTTVDSGTAIELTLDVSDAANGIIGISATATESAAMGGNGVWDLQATQGDVVKTWVRGKTKWIKDVTRA